jgi:hypothetical protein
MEKVDAGGNVIGFSVLKVSAPIAAHRDWTVGSSCAELPREPLGVAGGADRAVEVEGFPQRPVGRRRVADRGGQAAAKTWPWLKHGFESRWGHQVVFVDV